MLTPSTVSVQDYIAAAKEDAPYHIKVTFLAQNIVLEDEDIVADGFRKTSIFNSDTDLTIGKAIMDEVAMTIRNTSKIANLAWGQEFKIEFGLEVGQVTDWVTIGYFSGSKPERVYTVQEIDFLAYDRMSRFDVLADPWLDSLEYPLTVAQIYQSLCDYVGVTKEAGDELPNIMARTYTAPFTQARGMLCRDILAVIAEASGCYAKMTAGGNVKLRWFSDQQTYTLGATDEFDIESAEVGGSGVNWMTLETYQWDELENLTWEDLEGNGSGLGQGIGAGVTWRTLEQSRWRDLEHLRWGDLEGYDGALRINSVTVQLTEEDIGVSYPVKSGFNNYIIIDNPFLITKDSTEVNAYIVPLYNRLSGFGGYLPITAMVIGNALVEAGDVITVSVQGKNCRMPIFTKVMYWNGGMTDQYQNTGNLHRADVSPAQRQKLAEGGRYHKYINDINQLYSEVFDENGDSIIRQNSDGILLLAQNKYDVQSFIEILPAGIEVSGGKYIKIKSGGTFDVESENFEISSANQYMRSGQWTFNNNGLKNESRNDQNVMARFQVASGLPLVSSDMCKCGIMYYHVMTGQGLNLTYIPRMYFMASASGKVTYFETYFDPKNEQIAISAASGTQMSIGSPTVYMTNGYFTNLYYTNLNQSSSREIKHDIRELPSVGERLDQLEPVTFVYDDDADERTRTGLIYEDTVEVMPEICTGDESNKAISYMELVPMLLKEIQELRARVKVLEERED